MLLWINYPGLSLDDYFSLLPNELLGELTHLADSFKGIGFVHAISTAMGGGVAEILQSFAPLMNSLGVHTESIVVSPENSKFFEVTKETHNLPKQSNRRNGTSNGPCHNAFEALEQWHISNAPINSD